MLKGIPIINLWQTCLLGVSFVNFHLFESFQNAEPTNNEAVLMGCCVRCSVLESKSRIHNFRKTIKHQVQNKKRTLQGEKLAFP